MQASPAASKVVGGTGECVCLVCKRAFKPARNSRGKYCSSKCYGKTLKTSARHKQRAALERMAGTSIPVRWGECRCCGSVFLVRPNRQGKACGGCVDKHGYHIAVAIPSRLMRAKIEGRNCETCGKHFIPLTMAQPCCSEECRRQTAAYKEKVREEKRAWKKTEAGRRARRIYNRKRRARRFGNGPVDSIDPKDVFERDNWRCYICGTYTPKGLVGDPRDSRAPTLDHVVPLAEGGTHTFDNVRCACRGCNTEKGAAIFQRNLFESTGWEGASKV